MKKDAIIERPQEYLVPPEAPNDWDYDKSVKKVGGLVYKWKNITVEIANELYMAREKLSHHGGDRRSDQREKFPVETWDGYCEAIGIAKRTANGWLAAFFGLVRLPYEIKLPEGKYRVIYADPPWPVDSMILDKWESPLDDKYQTMTVDEIKALDIVSLCADDCSLFLWATHTYLHEALHVLEAWGFKYHCCITWDKGSGWSLCGFHRMTEFCLYAYKGKINVNQTGDFIPTLIKEKKGKHSQKPDIMYKFIESNTPTPRIELFARITRPGWTSWGNQI